MSVKVYEKTKTSREKLIDYGKSYKVDKTDKKILCLLNQNSRQSLAELSRKSGLTRDVIRYRIEKLVKQIVILGFKPVLNTPRLGLPVINHVYFLLKPETFDQEKKFVSHLKSNPQVISVSSLVGKWEYRVTIVAQNPSDFNNVLKKIRIKFPDLIKDFETMSILEQYKHDDYSGLFH
jgi:DNA-binding Lrp family transcriptional regulator